MNKHQRNQKIIFLLKNCGIEVEIYGGQERPLFIYQNKKILNLHVSAKRLHFTAKQIKLFTLWIRPDIQIDTPKIIEWFNSSDHKECFRVMDIPTGLYLTNTKPDEIIDGLMNFNDKGTLHLQRGFAESIVSNYFGEKYHLKIV